MKVKIDAELIDVAVALNVVPGDRIIVINGVVVAAQPHNVHHTIEARDSGKQIERLDAPHDVRVRNASDDKEVLSTLDAINKQLTNKEIGTLLGWEGPEGSMRVSNSLRRLVDKKRIVGKPASVTSTRNSLWSVGHSQNEEGFLNGRV